MVFARSRALTVNKVISPSFNREHVLASQRVLPCEIYISAGCVEGRKEGRKESEAPFHREIAFPSLSWELSRLVPAWRKVNARRSRVRLPIRRVPTSRGYPRVRTPRGKLGKSEPAEPRKSYSRLLSSERAHTPRGDAVSFDDSCAPTLVRVGSLKRMSRLFVARTAFCPSAAFCLRLVPCRYVSYPPPKHPPLPFSA